MRAPLLLALAFAVVLPACGGRTDLLVPSPHPDGSTPPPSCAPFPAVRDTVPRPLGEACTFNATKPASYPVLAAVAGQDLIALSLPQGTVSPLFHFGALGTASILSRGEFVGAVMVAGGTTAPMLDVELVVLRLDGTVLVHHRATFSTQSTDGGLDVGVVGNTGGTFAFGVALGEAGEVWVAVADGRLFGPFDGVELPYGGRTSPRVDPDARGRFLVLQRNGNSTADVSWLDPCTGSMTPPRLPLNGDNASGWGAAMFGLDASGQPSRETADGVAMLAVPPITMGSLWDFVMPGQAMFDVPPFPSGTSQTANLLILDAVTLEEHPVSLAYPAGLTLVPHDAWLSELGDSNDPAGFGLDSAGHVTMFLADSSGALRFEVSQHGDDWTPIGAAVTTDPAFDPSYSLGFAEAGGTYGIRGLDAMGGTFFQVARPASGVVVRMAGAPQIAADGGCVAALASPTELDTLNATTGELTPITLPAAVPKGTWASTWIPGDDAVTPPMP